MKRNDTTLEQTVFNVSGNIRFTVRKNEEGKTVLWVDSYDSICGMHTKESYKQFKAELVKTLKKIDKIQDVIWTKK